MHQHLAAKRSGVVWAEVQLRWHGTRRLCALFWGGGNPGAEPVTVSSAEVTIRSEQEL